MTIAEVLRTRGYHTLQFGKWHLGGKKGSRPEDQGFDEALGFIAGASMYLPEKDPDVVNSKQPWDAIDRFLWPNLPYQVQFNGSKMFAPKGYMTDYLGDEALIRHGKEKLKGRMRDDKTEPCRPVEPELGIGQRQARVINRPALRRGQIGQQRARHCKDQP